MSKQFHPDKQARTREETKGNDGLKKKKIEKIKLEDLEEEDNVVEQESGDAFFFQVIPEEETEDEDSAKS